MNLAKQESNKNKQMHAVIIFFMIRDELDTIIYEVAKITMITCDIQIALIKKALRNIIAFIF